MRLLLLALGLLLADGAAAQRIKVVVASETWDQLLYLDRNEMPKGPIVDFIKRMNQVQEKFDFQILVLPRLRLNQYFIDKKADVYPFRTTQWTEPALNLLATRAICISGDRYIARKVNRYGGMAVFDDLRHRTIVGVRGYHYRIFDNNPDEQYIGEHYSAILAKSNETVVQLILAGRGDVGVVPEAIVAAYFKTFGMRDKLLVSTHFDSQVELSNLVRKDGPISVEQMNHIIDLLTRSGDVEKIRAAFNIPPQ